MTRSLNLSNPAVLLFQFILIVFAVTLTRADDASVKDKEEASNPVKEEVKPVKKEVEIDPWLLERFEAKEFVGSQQDKLLYRLLSPAKNQSKDAKFPLVIFFHGAGERGDDNKAQLVHGMADFASDSIMKDFPCFVIAPQCPEGKRWVEVDWTTTSHEMAPEPSESLRLVIELIETFLKDSRVDKSRIYVTGLSMGGFGTWEILKRRPELFAAGAPICGGGDVALANRIKHIPLWVFHGERDDVVVPSRSRDMIAALKAVGAHPSYTEYAGVGHNSWEATYHDIRFYRWLFAQRVGAAP